MAIVLLTTTDDNKWRDVLPVSKNVFGSLEYARIHEIFFPKLEACLFVWSSDGQKIAYPFFLRSISSLPFASNETGWDITTPEYTGPILIEGNIVNQNSHFADDFNKFCRDYGIVAEFAHLNPWEFQDKILIASGIAVDREIIFVDLELSEESLWNDSFTYACRKNIRRAQKEGVLVFPATTMEHIQDFYRIYTQTMDRNDAQAKYYFPFEFFQAFYTLMPQHAQFMLATYNGEIVAGTLYLHDNDNVYSYLGGANHAFQRIRPSNLIVSEAIKWAKRSEKKRLVLGGGYKKDDGIFRFKSSFSSYRALFKVYKQIHSQMNYETLCRAWSDYYQTELGSTEYFPAYRSIL